MRTPVRHVPADLKVTLTGCDQTRQPVSHRATYTSLPAATFARRFCPLPPPSPSSRSCIVLANMVTRHYGQRDGSRNTPTLVMCARMSALLRVQRSREPPGPAVLPPRRSAPGLCQVRGQRSSVRVSRLLVWISYSPYGLRRLLAAAGLAFVPGGTRPLAGILVLGRLSRSSSWALTPVTGH